MQKNSLMKRDDSILRVLECHDDEVLVIDCRRLTMPTWKSIETLEGYTRCEDALDPRQHGFRDMDVLSPEAISDMHKRFTAVAGILPFLSNERERSRMVAAAAKQLNVSKHTVRNYLCLYMALVGLYGEDDSLLEALCNGLVESGCGSVIPLHQYIHIIRGMTFIPREEIIFDLLVRPFLRPLVEDR